MKVAHRVLTIFLILIILAGLSFVLCKYTSSYSVYETDYHAPATTTLPILPQVTHIKTPESVRAIYMSSWVAGSKKLRSHLVDIVDGSEINTIVIDVKDYSGRISFMASDPALQEIGSSENRIPDIKEFIGELHDKGIYIIGRISTFQDSYLVHKKPELAVKNKEGAVWKDYKGVSWLDAGAEPVWKYVTEIGDEAYSVGFDELNFDYIRFPSDGNMVDIAYPFSQGRVKSDVLNDFFGYLDIYFHKENIPISADLFGMTTSNKDDLGIGQILENALAHFDYVAPMVYPSHYPPNFNGWANPAAKPYEVIQYALSRGSQRAITASTTALKIRPWLQDFSINRTTYTPDMIRAQIQATYDVGLNSWMLWNAANVYTVSALETASSTVSTAHTLTH